MRKKLCCFMSAVLALSICMPGGAMQALAADGGAQPATSASASLGLTASGQTADDSQSSSSAVQEQGEQQEASDADEASQSTPTSADEPAATGQSQANGTGGSVAEEGTGSAADANLASRAPAQNLADVTVDGMEFSPVWEGDSQTGGYALSEFTGEGATLVIPASITGSDGGTHPVTAIHQDLQGYEKVEHLTIPDSVTEITNSAFTHCTNLKDVAIGSGVEELVYVFSGCTALKDVTFSPKSSLKRIDGGFSGCTSLTQLDLPDGLEEVSLGGTGIKELTLPDSVKKIYSYGFEDCQSLKRVNIPDGVTELGDDTFLDCPSLTTIEGGANVTKIGDRCFGWYDWDSEQWVQDDKLVSLGDIDLGKLTSIGDYAFYGAPNLPDQDLSLDSVTSLGEGAFYNDAWITKLALGDGLESITDAAFIDCYNIEEIAIPNSVKTIGDEAFKSVDAATIAVGSSKQSQLEGIGKNAFADETDGSSITINAAESDVNLKANSFGKLDNVTWTVPSVDETGRVLYLDGASGNDANDGTAKDKAVKTFARAKELAAANQDILYINVIGTTDVSGDVSLDGTNATLRRGPDFAGYLLQVKDGNTATLKDITVDGNARKANATKSLVYVKGATLNIEDGAILQNNRLTDLSWQSGWGGAVYADGGKTGGTVNMSGGAIRNNTANIGGGVCLDYGNTFNMSGGTITGNRAVTGTTYGDGGYACGGGIALMEKYGTTGRPMTLNLSGGTIEKNSSEDMGGGIGLGSGVSTRSQPILNMTGGSVRDNAAGSCGGGIFVQYGFDEKGSDRASYGIANISGGAITGNRMTGKGHGNKAFGGGGIYVNGGPTERNGTYYHKAELNLTNALITANEASLEGGGYASCPVSETHIYVKDGAALYGNEGRAGQELYILASTAYGAHSGDPVYTVADSMLGGTPYNWKYDDGTEVPLNKLEGKLSAVFGQKLSMHTDVTSDENAQRLAKVTISGNTSATRGGGIGSNGTVNIGEYDTTKIDVSKTWDDGENAGGKRPGSVAVELWRTSAGMADDSVYIGYETIRPDDDGNWNLVFTNLPKADADGNDYVYSLKERAVAGYASTVSGDAKSGFTVTNSSISDEKTSVSGTKSWDDDGNRDGVRPDSITVRLLADGTEVDSKTVTADDGWAYSFDGLAKYKADGSEVKYTVTEDAISNYATAISGTDVTNSYTPGKTSLTVTKAWDDADNQDGIRADSVKVQLYANGKPSGEAVELSADNNWTQTWTGLFQKEGGKDVAYTVQEVDAPAGYASTVSGDATAGFTIINAHAPEMIDIPVTKKWVGGEGGPVTVHLLADGEDTGKTVTLSADGGWTGSFGGLPKNKDGKAIAYTVSEDPVEGYASEVTGDATAGFTVTNTKNETPGKPGGGSEATPRGSLSKTGDEGLLPIALLAVAAVGALAAALDTAAMRRSGGRRRS